MLNLWNLCLNNFSELLTYILSFPLKFVFGVISDNYLYIIYIFFKDCKIRKIILVLIFVYYKLKLLDFHSDFVLIFNTVISYRLLEKSTMKTKNSA